MNIEIVTRGPFDPKITSNVVRIRIGKHTYDEQQDFEALQNLLQSSS